MGYYLKSTMTGNHEEWIGHGENYPNINHLDVSCLWERSRDSKETNPIIVRIISWKKAFKLNYLQGCQHKEKGWVNLNDHLNEWTTEGCGQLAYKE